jgi:hypothetical protein
MFVVLWQFSGDEFAKSHLWNGMLKLSVYFNRLEIRQRRGVKNAIQD